MENETLPYALPLLHPRMKPAEGGGDPGSVTAQLPHPRGPLDHRETLCTPSPHSPRPRGGAQQPKARGAAQTPTPSLDARLCGAPWWRLGEELVAPVVLGHPALGSRETWVPVPGPQIRAPRRRRYGGICWLSWSAPQGVKRAECLQDLEAVKVGGGGGSKEGTLPGWGGP